MNDKGFPNLSLTGSIQYVKAKAAIRYVKTETAGGHFANAG
jgi:hypothetical protein